MNEENNHSSFDSYNIVGGQSSDPKPEPPVVQQPASEPVKQAPKAPPPPPHHEESVQPETPVQHVQPQQPVQPVYQPPVQPQQPVQQPVYQQAPPQQPPVQPQQPYQQQAYQQPYQQQQQPYYPQQPYGQNIGKKKGKGSAVLFWILLVVLGGIALLLELTVVGTGTNFIKNYIGVISTAVVIVLLILIRKALYKSVIGHLIVWIISILLFVGIFGVMTGTIVIGDFNISQSTEYGNGAAKIVNEGTARTIDATTYKPLEKTTTFKVDDKMIYVVAFLDYVEAGITIDTIWSYNGSAVYNPATTNLSQEVKSRYFAQALPPASNGQYPTGSYSVEFVGKKDGNTIFSIKNTFEVK